MEASRALCLVSIREKAREISRFAGNEASVWWITPEAARSRFCHKAGESPIVVVVGSVDDHERRKRKEQGRRECGVVIIIISLFKKRWCV